MVITGKWKDGTQMTAIPNYARMNRVGPPHEYLGDADINYALGATTGNGGQTPARAGSTAVSGTPMIVSPSAGVGNTTPVGARRNRPPAKVESKVWI